MTRRAWDYDRRPLNGSFAGFYRDRENGWIFGVCAGVADRFNLRVGAVRIVALVLLVLFFWATALVYLAATVIVLEKPLIYSGRCAESDFWRSYRRQSYRRQYGHDCRHDSRDGWSRS